MNLFSIHDRLPDTGARCLGSPKDLRILANELELHGAYQIEFWTREAEHGGQIEILVTYEAPK